jgi:hypothetical protein
VTAPTDRNFFGDEGPRRSLCWRRLDIMVPAEMKKVERVPTRLCRRKYALLAAVIRAMDRIHTLNDREVEALVVCDFVKLNRLRIEVRKARRRKGKLLEDFNAHVNKHGCG